MATAITELQDEALESCKFRGHKMGKFNKYNISECTICKAWVQVDDKPAPNGIDIGGPAVALHCPTDPKWL